MPTSSKSRIRTSTKTCRRPSSPIESNSITDPKNHLFQAVRLFVMYFRLISILALAALTSAQAHASPGSIPYLSFTSPPAANSTSALAPSAPPASAPPAPAPPASAPAPAPSGHPAPAPPAAAPPGSTPLAPPVSSVNPVPAKCSINPAISMIQSGIKNPAFNTVSTRIPKPAPTYAKEPISFALSNIEFGTTLVQAPKPTIKPVDPDATSGEVLFCTSTAYTSWAGDDPNGSCDAVHSTWNECRSLSDVFKRKVMSVRPDKGQLCLFFADDDCYGAAEWIKWPGVQNLRGRIGEGNDWSKRIVSFRCTAED
ncbi:hypothetical protein BU25DRAFT_456650 [Macroventuria anomochaeta]|uniref:Uncharacterized protein n=1 Tax=Macroventuria anomochaeta TaxID=301207 RepID=A0ACB6S7R9_9PLEO|nr:uncharacterized protein BU25DRAFT_456650 [Macroventuria anomochaeta]KAF2629562.1 hypothetical protein BU25DRAFT_456650 [Macroventuria anomochaeta]